MEPGDVTNPSGTTDAGSLSNVTLPYAVSVALSGDTIIFDPTNTNGVPIVLQNTLTMMANNLTITRTGPPTPLSAVALIEDINVTAAVTASSISGVTIENGVIAGYGGLGGDILNSGTLTLTDSTITGGCCLIRRRYLQLRHPYPDRFTGHGQYGSGRRLFFNRAPASSTQARRR